MAPANRSEPRLELLLEPYDGRHAEVLKEIAAAVAPTAATLRQAVRLAEHERTIIAQGATWLLWTWLSAGARCTPKLAAELVARLPHLDDKWVMLHVTRCLPSLPLQP
ncbi:MAG: hypothetical protein KAI24_12800, partial [Planctomycetes bacterium]|nr:hypothetical protein [Planctomycetota bacterium]